MATGLDHVAIAVADVKAAAGVWRQTLGIEAEDRLEAPAATLRIASLSGGETKIALAQALHDQHPIAEWIAGRGPGMYAIAIQVDDIVAAVTDLRAKGVRTGDVEFGAWPGTRVARIDRDDANGVSVQLVQRLPEVL
jgi:methylmalonyl-CoA/ethylmalonyl-CoA epimerase